MTAAIPARRAMLARSAPALPLTSARRTQQGATTAVSGDPMKNATEEPTTDEALRAVVARLARPHRSGGSVIERAAILAEGECSSAIVDWILRHDGEAEVVE